MALLGWWTLLSHPVAVTCPPPSTVPPRTSLPAPTLAESLTSEPLHTSRFTTVTAGGGRGLTIGTHFFGGMCVNTKKVFQPNYFLEEQNQGEGLE